MTSIFGKHPQACFFKISYGNNLFITDIYVSCNIFNRGRLWNYFESLAQLIGDQPWVLGRDLNVVRNKDELFNIRHIHHANLDHVNRPIEKLNLIK
jgi:hypothetical protein